MAWATTTPPATTIPPTTTSNPIVTTPTTTQNATGTITTTVTQSSATVTNTTTVDTNLGVAVTDVSYIPYMRAVDIDFIGYGLRPSRQIWHFFDGRNMEQYIQKMNVIDLDTKKSFQDFINSPRELVSILGSNTTVFLAENNASGNTRLYVGEISNPKSNVHIGNTIIGLTSGLIGNVVSYQHHSGFLKPNSNISFLFLSNDADGSTNNVYVGNTITMVTGPGAGQSSNIISYNAASRIAQVSPSFSNVGATSNSIYSIGDYRQLYSENLIQGTWTTSKGFEVGTLHIPDPSANSEYMFLTGSRLYRIIDNPREDLTDYTTRADYNFTSNGLDVSTTQLINRTITNNTVTTITDTISNTFTAFPPPAPVVNPPVTPVVYSSFSNGNSMHQNDPIAQSFTIDSNLYPSGVFVPSISVFFANKDVNIPIQMQIRPMDNGYPSSSVILPGASIIIQPEDVIITDAPNASDLTTATTFTFPSPVYLLPGQSYAFVILSDSYAYDIYCSELGQEVLGTNRIVSQQPFLGSMFKSQNASTYTAIQSDDIMFVINKCVFTNQGTIQFSELKSLNPSTSSNSFMDMFQVHSDSAQIADTSISYAFKATSNSNNVIDPVWTSMSPDQSVLLGTRKIVYGPHISVPSFEMQIAMATINPDVSPIVFRNRQQLITIQEQINNLGLTNSIVIIANTGNGYFSSNTSLIFNANTGAGANGYIVANTNGGIDSVIIDNPGFGYSDGVTVSIISSTGNNGSILVSTETGSIGGPASFRYISETVTLQDNYDGGDLRVYLTANKPGEAEIDVYYKVRNSLDPTPIDDNNWFHMQQITAAEIVSTDLNDSISYEYAPSLTSNNIVYSTPSATYKTFNQFKIKIVGSSSDTVPEALPSIQDMTAIALVADVF